MANKDFAILKIKLLIIFFGISIHIKNCFTWVAAVPGGHADNWGSIGVFHYFDITRGNRSDHEVFVSFCSDPIDFYFKFYKKIYTC